MQVIKCKLTIIPWYLTLVYTYHCGGVFKILFTLAVVICWSLLSEKGTEKFFCTQGTLQGGRIEDHRMMFTRHMHLPQWYIQAILYKFKTDYLMFLIAIHILYPPHICWQQRLLGMQTNKWTEDSEMREIVNFTIW